MMVRSFAQVLVRTVRIHDLAGVHLPVRIPDPLELPESFYELGPEHLPEQARTRLAITMFTRQRPAVRDHQVGRLLQELHEVKDVAASREIEIDAAVKTAIAELAIQRGIITKAAEQLAKLAQVRAHVVRRYCRIFPTGIGV